MSYVNFSFIDFLMLMEDMCEMYNGIMVGLDCGYYLYVVDVFFLFVILFFGIYVIVIFLKDFKISGYFFSFVSLIEIKKFVLFILGLC